MEAIQLGTRNLTRLRDEDLVVLATRYHYQPAEAVLLLRYQEWSNKLITSSAVLT